MVASIEIPLRVDLDFALAGSVKEETVTVALSSSSRIPLPMEIALANSGAWTVAEGVILAESELNTVLGSVQVVRASLEYIQAISTTYRYCSRHCRKEQSRIIKSRQKYGFSPVWPSPT
jgi:hypothetical protein